MTEVLVPADPVKMVRTFLTDKYPWSVTVTKNRPNPTTGRVVTVRRSGGTRPLMVVDAAWLSVECFATTDEDAANLAHQTWGLLFSMAGETISGVQCYSVTALAAPSDFPSVDASVSTPRYVMSVQATFRA